MAMAGAFRPTLCCSACALCHGRQNATISRPIQPAVAELRHRRLCAGFERGGLLAAPPLCTRPTGKDAGVAVDAYLGGHHGPSNRTFTRKLLARFEKLLHESELF